MPTQFRLLALLRRPFNRYYPDSHTVKSTPCAATIQVEALTTAVAGQRREARCDRFRSKWRDPIHTMWQALLLLICITGGSIVAADSHRPATPVNLIGEVIGDTAVISWDPGTGGVEVAGYNVYRNGSYLATVKTTLWSGEIEPVSYTHLTLPTICSV